MQQHELLVQRWDDWPEEVLQIIQRSVHWRVSGRNKRENEQGRHLDMWGKLKTHNGQCSGHGNTKHWGWALLIGSTLIFVVLNSSEGEKKLCFCFWVTTSWLPFYLNIYSRFCKLIHSWIFFSFFKMLVASFNGLYYSLHITMFVQW